MKKIVIALALGLSVMGSAYATNGYLYGGNVNDVFGSTNKIQFKIVAKDGNGREVKAIESDKLMPRQVFSYKLSDFGLTQGFLDAYARDPEKSPHYNKCEEGYPYDNGITVIFHGWSGSQSATCAIAEDVSASK